MTLSFPSTLTIPKISFSGHRLEINSSVVDRANSIPSKIGVTFDIYSERDTLTTDKELNTYTNSVKFFFDGSLTKEQIKTILGNKLLQQTPQREKTSFDYLSSFVAESIFTDDQTDGKKIKVLGFCYPENNLSKDDLKAFFAVNLMALIQSAKDSKEKFSFIIPQPPGKLINSDLAIKTFFDALEETYEEYKPLIDKHIENFIVQLPESLLMDLKRYVKDTAFIKLADFSLYDLARKFAQNNIQTPLPINGNPSRLPGYNGYKAHETDFDSWLAKKCRNIHSLAYKNSAQKLQSLLSSSSTTTTKLRGGNFWFRSRISTSCIPSLATSSSPPTIRAEFAFESPTSLTSPVSHDVEERQLIKPSVHLVPRLKYKRPPGRSRILGLFSHRRINHSEFPSPSPSPSTERNSSEFSLKNGKSSNEQAHFVFFVEQAVQGLDKLQDFRTNPDHAKNLLKIISFAKEKNGVSRKKDELQTFFQDDTNLTKQACTFSYNFQRLMIEYGNVEDENGKHPRSRLFRNIKLKNVEALFENLNLNNEENYKKLTSSLKESDPLKSRSRITSFFRQ